MVKAAERKGLSGILKTKAAAVTAKQKGILLMIMSAFLFSAVQVFVRMTGDAVPLMEQVFFRLTYSYRMAPASEVSIYNYSGILFSMILGFIMLGETVPYNSLIGGGLVILASFLTYRYSRHPVE